MRSINSTAWQFWMRNRVRVETLRLSQQLKVVPNSHTDRLLFYTDSGMFQGLHEAALVEPHVYVRPALPAKPKKATGEAAPTTPPGTTPEPCRRPKRLSERIDKPRGDLAKRSSSGSRLPFIYDRLLSRQRALGRVPG